jgi:AAA family ATP:ADP antiporter
VNARAQRKAEPAAAAEAQAPLGPEGAFSLIWRTPYLFWMALLIVLLNVVNTSGEFILSKLVVDEAAARFGDSADLLADRQRFIGAFFGSFFSWVNLIGLVLQLFFTSRLIRIMGVRGTLFVLPIVAFVNYAVIAVAPLLAVVRVTKTLENSTNYSIQNTVREALFLPTSREAKYKAKTAMETLGARVGDVLQAGIVRVGTALDASVTAFSWFTLLLTVAWMLVAGRIVREHRKQTL